MPLVMLAGAAVVWLAVTAAALPVLKQNETTLFVYDLLDDWPWAVASVAVVGLAALVGAWWICRSWKIPVGIVVAGVALGVVGLVVGQVLFVPWVAK